MTQRKGEHGVDDDATLALRIATGADRDAEAALCRRWLPRVRAYGRVHLRDREAASDFAQDVLVVLLRALRAGEVEECERLAAYVSGVCRNVVRDWRRTDQRKQALLQRFGPGWDTNLPPPPSVDRERLAACLHGLEARDLAIVALTYFAGRSGDEIALELVMTAGSVRSARHRALAKLHQCLEAAT
jgi:RNA polymerase sigma-70 factor (ECF subfamily)